MSRKTLLVRTLVLFLTRVCATQQFGTQPRTVAASSDNAINVPDASDPSIGDAAVGFSRTEGFSYNKELYISSGRSSDNSAIY